MQSRATDLEGRWLQERWVDCTKASDMHDNQELGVLKNGRIRKKSTRTNYAEALLSESSDSGGQIGQSLPNPRVTCLLVIERMEVVSQASTKHRIVTYRAHPSDD